MRYKHRSNYYHLALASEAIGQVIKVNKISADADLVIVTIHDGNTIEGMASKTLAS